MDYESDAFAGLLAALGVFAILILIIIIPILVVFIIAKCKMYKKAGKNGWEAIVPIYSDWVYTEIAGVEWWWFVALIITNLGIFNVNTNGGGSYININFGTLIGLFGAFVCNYNISKKLHKDVGFAVLMTLFPFVMVPLIGFSGSYSFDNSVKVTKNGPFDANKENNNVAIEKQEEDVTNKDKDVKFCTKCGNKLDKDSKFCPKCGKEI